MRHFCIERDADKQGRSILRYSLTQTRKLVEGYGIARVYGVSCSFVSRPDTEVTVDDISSNENRAVEIIFTLAKQCVLPTELLSALRVIIS